ncbi:MAG: N-methyl-L-tryptophan oxidase [Sporichthyaceae bacterium]
MNGGRSSRSYDAIVVGLGGMGSAAAYHLASRGSRVLGLERFGLGHDRGSSHGGPRIIRLAYFEDPAYVPLLLRAYELWRRLCGDAGSDLMVRTGGLLLGGRASSTVAGALRSAAQWGLDHELLDAREIRRRFPTLAPADGTVAVFEAVAGLQPPEGSVRAQHRRAQAAGAECRFEQPVVGWEAAADGDGVSVRTAAGTFHGDRLVVCTGAYAGALLAELSIPLAVERQLHTWFAPEAGVEEFLPDRHPVWIWEADEETSGAGVPGLAYGFPALDGSAGGVKMNVVLDADRCTPDTVDRSVSAADLELVAAHLRRRLASDPGPLLRVQTCLYENTPDRHFVLGPHPRHRQVLVAAGFSGHGFKFASVVGEILADLAIDGSTTHPIELFDPNRMG